MKCGTIRNLKNSDVWPALKAYHDFFPAYASWQHHALGTLIPTLMKIKGLVETYSKFKNSKLCCSKVVLNSHEKDLDATMFWEVWDRLSWKYGIWLNEVQNVGPTEPGSIPCVNPTSNTWIYFDISAKTNHLTSTFALETQAERFLIQNSTLWNCSLILG